MSRPPFDPFIYITSHPQGIPGTALEPTPEFFREVEGMLLVADTPREVAQWVAERIEEYATQWARPVFDMGGNGPFCSACGAIGAICGHPERSIIADDEGR